MRRAICVLIGVTCVLWAVAAAAAAESATTSAELWKRRCAACHGEDGRGKTRTGEKYAIPDLTAATWQSARTDAQIRATILDGSPHMPGFSSKLSGEEVNALVRQVRSFGKPTPAR